MSYEELMDLARPFEGKELQTVTGKKFTVGVSTAEHCPYFTPSSSGYSQTGGRKAAERFLARYNQIGSLRPSDYSRITRDASYYVGLLAKRDQ